MCRIKKMLPIIISLILSSCTTPLSVSINSISATGSEQKKKYIIMPEKEGCSYSDLQFVEFARYTDRALQSRGFKKVLYKEEADIAISLGYDMKYHTYQYNYSLPVYGQTGIASSTTSGTWTNYNNISGYSGQTTYTPAYGVVGSQTYTGTGVSFTHWLRLTGFDLAKYKITNNAKDASQLWYINVVSVCQSGDQRRVFPVMLAACRSFIATNTHQTITVEIKEDDKRVYEILGSAREKELTQEEMDKQLAIRTAKEEASRKREDAQLAEQKKINDLLREILQGYQPSENAKYVAKILQSPLPMDIKECTIKICNEEARKYCEKEALKSDK